MFDILCKIVCLLASVAEPYLSGVVLWRKFSFVLDIVGFTVGRVRLASMTVKKSYYLFCSLLNTWCSNFQQ
jgi:hypothetical protein